MLRADVQSICLTPHGEFSRFSLTHPLRTVTDSYLCNSSTFSDHVECNMTCSETWSKHNLWLSNTNISFVVIPNKLQYCLFTNMFVCGQLMTLKRLLKRVTCLQTVCHSNCTFLRQFFFFSLWFDFVCWKHTGGAHDASHARATCSRRWVILS